MSTDCSGFAAFKKLKLCFKALTIIMKNDDLNEEQESKIESDARFYNNQEYRCLPSSVLFKNIRKSLKKREGLKNMDRIERNALAILICQFVSSSGHIYFDCIQCGVGIRIDHHQQCIY